MLFSALIFTLVFPFSSLGGFWPQFSYPSVSRIQRPVIFNSVSAVPGLTPKHSASPTVRFTPTPKPTSVPSPVATPVPTSTPLPEPSSTPFSVTPSPTPVTTPAPANSDNQTSYFLEQINNYRHSQGLASVQTDTYTCNFAALRAQEIAVSFNHDGFTNRINSKSLPYPSYHFVTENIAMNSNSQNVINAWINSPGHAANMRADTLYVCVKSSGNFYAYEGWKP